MEGHGIQAMSVGFLIEPDTPMVWRGPMVTQALEQLLTETKWRDLDYLVVDLPPGTGDIQLTLAQKVPGHRRRDRHHAPGHRAHRRAQGPQDVREGRHPDPRHRREHGDPHLLELRPRRAHLRRRRRRAHEQGLRRRAAGQPAARHPHPRAGRFGQAHGGRRSRRRRSRRSTATSPARSPRASRGRARTAPGSSRRSSSRTHYGRRPHEHQERQVDPPHGGGSTA